MVLRSIFKKILPLILKEVFPKLKPLEDYVNKPNKNDKAIANLKKELKEIKEIVQRLEGVAHPPFFTSEAWANFEDRLKVLEKELKK